MASKNITWEISELKNIEILCKNDTVYAEHIETFLKHIISNASIRTGISKGDIIRYNIGYYDYFEQIFTYSNKISTKSEEFITLCSMFKVPVINNTIRSKEGLSLGNVREKREEKLLNYPQNAENIINKSNGGSQMERGGFGFIPEERVYSHKDCMDIFNKLSAVEKIKFIMEFQNVEIKLSPAEILVFKSC